ncbi:orexin receptor type 1-like [Acanthaster planci]|uniref:Orexin receptor type 1-like n=1 Tax=Acanthaster planci TaxID=133434 RepID=A0A8B7ZQW9_ACAPL|nr:orexin receptor type 1-like [Acanthaster planci]
MGSEHLGPNNSNPNPPPLSLPFSPTETPAWMTDEYMDELYQMLQKVVMPNAHEWFLIAVYAVLFLTGLAGNLLVCFAVLRNEHMRTVTNYYIVNMAVADVLVIVLCLPANVIVDTTETWFFGEMACRIFPYIQEVTVSVSVYTLVAIAVDRYLAICRPLKFHIRASRTLFIVVCIWLLSFTIMVPQAVFVRLQPNSIAEQYGNPVWMTACMESGWNGTTIQKVYHVARVVVTYILPLVLMGVAYALVCLRLWSGIPTDEAQRPGSAGHSKQVTMNKSTETQLESRRKVARMLIVVVVMFAVCNLPTHVLNVIRHMEGFHTSPEVDPYQLNPDKVTVAFVVAHFMMYFNNAINPVIYNFLSARFRKEFQRAFSCCPCVSVPERRKRPGSASYQRCRDFTARSGNNGVSQTDYRSHDHSTEYLQLSKLGKANGANNNSAQAAKSGVPSV